MKRAAILIVLFASGLLLAMAGPANAQSWGPLTSYYNNIARSKMWGNNYEYANAQIINASTIQDLSNDGNTVYGHTRIRWYEYISITDTWVWGDWSYTLNSPETTGTISWNKSWQENGNAIHAENESWTCVQLGWPVPNQCSPHAYAQVKNYR